MLITTLTSFYQFLKSHEFVFDAIPANYLDEPPLDISAAERNLLILRELMKPGSLKRNEESTMEMIGIEDMKMEDRSKEKEMEEGVEVKGTLGNHSSEENKMAGELDEWENDDLDLFLEEVTGEVYIVLDRLQKDLEAITQFCSDGETYNNSSFFKFNVP